MKALALAATVTGLSSLFAQDASAREWAELAHYRLGGEGGWDLMAVDAHARRLYIARSDRVIVVDVDTGKLVGEVPGLDHAHGVALAAHLHRGYATSGGDDRVIAFDLDSLRVTDRIPTTGKNPDAIVFDETSERLFAFNGHSDNVSVIDAATNKVVATIALPGKPELAVSDGHGKVYVNLEDKSEVAKIDARSAKVETTWKLGACEEPTGLAIDAAHNRLFSVCANHQMAVLDSKDGRLVGSLPIGDGPDGAAFDSKSAMAFSSNSDGTLTLVHEDDPGHFRVVANVVTPARSRTIVLDDKTHHAVLATGEFDAAPAATAENPHPRPVLKTGSFGFVVIGVH